MRTLAVLLAITLAIPARAVDRDRVAAINIAATSLFTYAGCLVHARMHRGHAGAARCLAAGAVAGTGFYQAKRLAGHGDITTAWLLANLSTSVAENTVAGEHPLSRLGYTFGPFRLRLATPFDRARESIVDVDLSVAESGFLVRALVDADDVDIRDGMIWYETRGPQRDGNTVFHGYTWGIFPGVWSGARATTWHHESVHAVQSLQLESVEPAAFVVDRQRRVIRFRSIHAGALNILDNVTWAQFPYDERWAEIEAYRMSENRTPPK